MKKLLSIMVVTSILFVSLFQGLVAFAVVAPPTLSANLVAVPSDDPVNTHFWRIDNSSNVDIEFDYTIHGSGVRSERMTVQAAPAGGRTTVYFQTSTSNFASRTCIADFYYQGTKFSSKTKASNNTVNVSTAVYPEDAGTISQVGPVAYNSQITVLAEANEGYRFVRFEGDQPDENGKITVTKKVDVKAIFEPISTDKVAITVAIPRRMSVRLENGTILKNGDKFNMPKFGTVKFQMCTNNWDTDTYTDDGQGIAGTKVFEYTHFKGKDLFLRVNTNKYFMAVRFSFAKGNYNKQTGINQVLSTPLESLSVNLPLGSTITADAYIALGKVNTTNLFVETAADKTISYTDYIWQD
jgi:hypothetical protein